MLSRATYLTIAFALFWAASASAAVIHYVSLSSPGPVAPYTSWATAAANIQDAVDATTNGDQILVTNGVYNSGSRITSDGATNRVVLTNAVTLQSVNGPAVTVIDGGHAARCAYLSNGVSLAGFTLTNGHAVNGGGAWCQSTNAFVSNSIFITNAASDDGGGAYSGTLNNCLLMGNSAVSYGGGSYSSTLNDCLVVSNVANIAGGAEFVIMNNCTVVGNSAKSEGGGVDHGSYKNCVLYYNTQPGGGSGSNYLFDLTLSNCCTAPPPTAGLGNITNAPLFVNQAGGDFHLQSNSPCINAGNNTFVAIANDFDGNSRISGGTVDIGAYEFQNPASIISYAWLQQYGLANDGSADFADPDRDGLNNYQEWRAGTAPTNAASVLSLSRPVISGTNIIVTWQSVTTRTYYLQRSLGLGSPPVFLPLATNIPGHANTTSYTDTNAASLAPLYYRVGVQ